MRVESNTFDDAVPIDEYQVSEMRGHGSQWFHIEKKNRLKLRYFHQNWAGLAVLFSR